MAYNLASLLAFPLFATYSVSAELVSPRSASRVSLLLALGYVIACLAAPAPFLHMASGLSCGLAVLLVTFALFCFGWISSGDAKIVAALSIWIGWDHLIDFALAAVAGGLLLSQLLERWRARPLSPALSARHWLVRLHDESLQVPYGVAAAIAGLMMYPGAPEWLTLLGHSSSI